MTRHIALLRGINVSGQKKILMTELSAAFESLGFSSVKTYIQSGNVVFCSSSKSISKICKTISSKIEEVYNFNVPVIILTEQKLKMIISSNPFKNKDIDLSKLYITFLDTIPDKSLLNSIEKFRSPSEIFIIEGDVIYLYLPDGAGRTKLNNNLLENKLKVTATSRNWKTTNKLFELINELECGSKSNREDKNSSI